MGLNDDPNFGWLHNASLFQSHLGICRMAVMMNPPCKANSYELNKGDVNQAIK